MPFSIPTLYYTRNIVQVSSSQYIHYFLSPMIIHFTCHAYTVTLVYIFINSLCTFALTHSVLQYYVK